MRSQSLSTEWALGEGICPHRSLDLEAWCSMPIVKSRVIQQKCSEDLLGDTGSPLESHPAQHLGGL